MYSALLSWNDRFLVCRILVDWLALVSIIPVVVALREARNLSLYPNSVHSELIFTTPEIPINVETASPNIRVCHPEIIFQLIYLVTWHGGGIFLGPWKWDEECHFSRQNVPKMLFDAVQWSLTNLEPAVVPLAHSGSLWHVENILISPEKWVNLFNWV